jgi:hypothetical protein
MKRNLLVASLGTLAFGTLFSLSAAAQTCTAPTAWQPPPAGSSVTGTTCGGDTTAAGYCGGNLDAPGPAYVISSTFNSGTFTNISLTGGAGYDAVMYISASATGCGTNAACTATGDTGAAIPSTDVPNGSYFIIVTAATFDTAGQCGTFTISSDGSFPVSLQDFSVS